MKAVLVILLFLVQHQLQPRVTTTLNANSGLSNNIIHCVFQDSDGFIWIGTDSGLNRFDGYEVVTYFNQTADSSSLSSNTIRSIVQDKYGILWIGSYNGLNRYDQPSDSFVRFIELPDLPTSRLDLQDMVYDERKHRIWFNTLQTAGWFDIETEEFHFFEDDYDSFSISYHEQRLITLSKQNELFMFDDETEELFRIGAINERRFNPLYVGEVSKKIWLPSQEIDDATFPFLWNSIPETIASKNIYGLIEVDEELIWIGTDEGLFEYNLKHERISRIDLVERPSFLTNSITSLYKDNMGGIWVGTLGGLFYFSSAYAHFQHLDLEEESADVVMGIAVHDEKILLNTFSSKVLEYDLTTGNIDEMILSSKLNNGELQIWDIEIVPDSDYTYWFATNSGLVLFDLHNNRIERRVFGEREIFSQVVFAIEPAEDGSMFISSINNIHEVSRKDGSEIQIIKTEEFVKQSNIQDMEFIDGYLYVATEGEGLAKVDVSTGSITEIKPGNRPENPLKNNAIWDLYLKDDRELWIGTSRGLFLFEALEEEFTGIDFDSNIKDRIVYSILSYNDEIWVGTESGLIHILTDQKISNVFRENEAIQNSEFNRRSALKTEEGTFFFGGVNGVTVFNPEEVPQNLSSFPVHILNMEVYLTDTSFVPSGFHDREVQLPWHQNTVEFSFAALNYSNPKNIHYRYQLVGIDENWVQSKQRRTARYAQLPPGDYQFRVQASFSPQFFDPNESSMAIKIQPPFWQTSLFRIAIILLVMLILWVIYRYRVNHLLELERIRLRIARDLHDEVGSGLSGIALSGDILSTKLELEENGNTEQLKKITNNARALASSLDSIVWMIDANKETLQDFITKCRSVSKELLIHHQVEFIVTIPEDKRSLSLNASKKRHLFLLLKESLNNILKHASASKVEIIFKYEAPHFLMKISDNGSGFNPEESFSGNGLESIKHRTIEMDAKLALNSMIDEGTEIEIQLKLP